MDLFFFFNDTATTEIYTLSLHDALPICWPLCWRSNTSSAASAAKRTAHRSEEHTSELQSRFELVCRLLLEKKNKLTSMDAVVYTRTDSVSMAIHKRML